MKTKLLLVLCAVTLTGCVNRKYTYDIKFSWKDQADNTVVIPSKQSWKESSTVTENKGGTVTGSIGGKGKAVAELKTLIEALQTAVGGHGKFIVVNASETAKSN